MADTAGAGSDRDDNAEMDAAGDDSKPGVAEDKKMNIVEILTNYYLLI